MPSLLAGVYSVNLTPPIGAPLSGFGSRTSPSVGVHDDLYARALVLDDGSNRIALVAADLIGLDPDLVAHIRGLVERGAGVPGAHLLLSCTHTHSGPCTLALRGIGWRDEALHEITARKIAGAVTAAAHHLTEALWGVGREPVQIGINRRQATPQGTVLGQNPGGPVAPYVDVLRVDAKDGRPLATIFSHAAHPVSQSGPYISADYCGYASAFIERARGGVAPFLQGCCGDVNCQLRGPWEDTGRMGTALGAAAVQCAEGIALSDAAGPLRALTRTIQLPQLLPESVEVAERTLQGQREMVARVAQDPNVNAYLLNFYKAHINWAEDYLRIAREGGRPRCRPFEIQTLAIGDVAFIAWPGEMFVAYQLFFDRASLFRHTFPLGYANGLIGYVPTADAYPLGGYEVDTAYRYFGTLMVAPDCERLIREATLDLLGELRGG